MRILGRSLACLVFLCAVAFTPVFAQDDEVWTDASDLLGQHPEIIANTLTRVGVTPNAGVFYAGYEFWGEEFKNYWAHDQEAWVTSQHTDYLWFTGDIEDPDDFLYSHIGDASHLTLLVHKDYYLDGYRVLIWKYKYDSGYTKDVGYSVYGLVELPSRYGYWQGFEIGENCEDSCGVHMPDMEDVISSFIVTLKDFGLTTAPELATQQAALPTPTTYIYEAPPLEPSELTEGNAEDALEDTATAQGEDLAESAVITAAIGAALGAALIVMLRGLPPKPPELTRSPISGRMVNEDELLHEQSLVEQGFVYNPKKEGFDYVPQAEKTFTPVRSALQPDLEKITADAKTRRQAIAWKAKTNIRAAYEEDMQRYQIDYHMAMAEAAHWNRALVIYTLVEKGADIAIDTLAVIPGGKVIKEVYGTGKAAIKFMNTAKDRGVTVAILQYGVDKLADDAMSKIPVPFKKNGDGSLVDSLGNALSQDVAKGNLSIADASDPTPTFSLYNGILGEGQNLP